MAKLSVIGTPIGNLEDITLRALRTLAEADLILCEDTRETKKLLARHNISKPTLSYHAQSKISRTDEIITHLKEGKNLVLVSDAGTPGISDPGAELVARVRAAFGMDKSQNHESDENFRRFEKTAYVQIEAIPGPSALTASLSIAGVPCADFTFLGFLPHKKGRETLFKEIVSSERTMVFYESPHRIMKTLESLQEHLNGSTTHDSPFKKKVTICRELTKVFEEVVSGTAEDVKKYFESNQDKVKGEFVVIVSK